MNKINTKICNFLSDLGIKYYVFDDETIAIDRTSMVIFFPELFENYAYDEVMKAIKSLLKEDVKYVYWGGRTDDWMGIYFLEK